VYIRKYSASSHSSPCTRCGSVKALRACSSICTGGGGQEVCLRQTHATLQRACELHLCKHRPTLVHLTVSKLNMPLPFLVLASAQPLGTRCPRTRRTQSRAATTPPWPAARPRSGRPGGGGGGGVNQEWWGNNGGGTMVMVIVGRC
jgi:hypothetical protein